VPFTIREFNPADFETLWNIDQTCFPPGISYSRTELMVYMRRRGSFTLVAVNPALDSFEAELHTFEAEKESQASQSAIAGFIVAESGRSSGHIITIDVAATARRSGAGSLLLSSAESRLRAAQCRSVQLETAVDNLSAMSFYKHHGYSVVKTYPRYYSNGVDALVFVKELGKVRE
jgi:[ribosomal protein S18]-alanine N-acetyltransferase